MPPKRKINDDYDDGQTPPPTDQEKPKNYALLVARAKAYKRKAKTYYRCECGKRLTTGGQLSNHRRTHGS